MPVKLSESSNLYALSITLYTLNIYSGKIFKNVVYMIVEFPSKARLHWDAQSINEVELIFKTLDDWGSVLSWAFLYAIIAERNIADFILLGLIT